MTWMITRTGARVDLRCMLPDTISTLDIAHSLALTNRFNGHTCRPYSVAEHSLLVCDIAERVLHVRQPAVLMAALMHDAHEAYTGDLSTPMKQILGEEWAVEEERIQHRVLQRFGLVTISTAHRATIKQADLIALATEKRDLLTPDAKPWPVLESIEPVAGINLLQDRQHFTWDDWRTAFIDRFAELHFALDLRQRA